MFASIFGIKKRAAIIHKCHFLEKPHVLSVNRNAGVSTTEPCPQPNLLPYPCLHKCARVRADVHSTHTMPLFLKELFSWFLQTVHLYWEQKRHKKSADHKLPLTRWVECFVCRIESQKLTLYILCIKKNVHKQPLFWHGKCIKFLEIKFYFLFIHSIYVIIKVTMNCLKLVKMTKEHPYVNRQKVNSKICCFAYEIYIKG